MSIRIHGKAGSCSQVISWQVVNEALRQELLTMRDEDQEIREGLAESGELVGSYVKRMERLHVKNAQRLTEILGTYGWPDERLVAQDGAEVAWFIVQHAIGLPQLQRKCLAQMKRSAENAQIPSWHAAYLKDRIAMFEGRSQRYGTQWLDDPEAGRSRPWNLERADRVDALRAQVGLGADAPNA